jgi:hypothetical protein
MRDHQKFSGLSMANVRYTSKATLTTNITMDSIFISSPDAIAEMHIAQSDDKESHACGYENEIWHT